MSVNFFRISVDNKEDLLMNFINLMKIIFIKKYYHKIFAGRYELLCYSFPNYFL